MAEAIDIRELNERIERQSAFVTNLMTGMDQVIVGQKHLVESLLIGLLSDGHILLEGVPGLAKTLAIKTQPIARPTPSEKTFKIQFLFFITQVFYSSFLTSLTICPSNRLMIRPANPASCCECVTMTIAVPSLFSSFSSSITSFPFFESRLPVGSSASISLGFATPARAIATR